MLEPPHHWSNRTFYEVATINTGLVDPRLPRIASHLHVGPDNIDSESGVVLDDLKTGAELNLISGKFLFAEGDILYSKIRPNLNKVAIAHHPGICSADMYVIKPADEHTDSAFLFHKLRSEQFYKEAVAASMRSGLPKVNREDLGLISLTMPPVEEQRRIAAVLNTWDVAIAAAQEVISIEVRQLKVLRSQLVEGESVPLSRAASVRFSGVDKKIEQAEQLVKLCNYMHIWRHRRLTYDISYDAGSAAPREIADFALQEGDFIFTKDSETAEEIAEVAYVAETMPDVVCGYHLAVGRPRAGYCGAYLAHAMRLPRVRNEFAKRANGAIRFGLTLEALEQVRIPVPGESRQRLVALALDAADDAIAAARFRLSLLRRQKRGLMQKLLTGKWRVPEAIEPLMPDGKIGEALDREPAA